MMTCMTLAFFCASGASQLTHFDHRAQHVFVRAGATRCQRSSGITYIRAIQIEPNALPQLLDHRFGEARVCT
jgi:hypothetical protein